MAAGARQARAVGGHGHGHNLPEGEAVVHHPVRGHGPHGVARCDEHLKSPVGGELRLHHRHAVAVAELRGQVAEAEGHGLGEVGHGVHLVVAADHEDARGPDDRLGDAERLDLRAEGELPGLEVAGDAVGVDGAVVGDAEEDLWG